MANIKSQIKRIKTNAQRTERNKAVKSELRTWIRKFRAAAESGDKAAAQDALKVASTKLDKAIPLGWRPVVVPGGCCANLGPMRSVLLLIQPR